MTTKNKQRKKYHVIGRITNTWLLNEDYQWTILNKIFFVRICHVHIFLSLHIHSPETLNLRYLCLSLGFVPINAKTFSLVSFLKKLDVAVASRLENSPFMLKVGC